MAALLFAALLVAGDSFVDLTDLPISSLLDAAHSHLSEGQAADALPFYDAAIARDPTNYLT